MNLLVLHTTTVLMYSYSANNILRHLKHTSLFKTSFGISIYHRPGYTS